MRIVSPKLHAKFTVDATPTWPSIVFQTDQAGEHRWTWTIAWKSFSKHGKATTVDGALTLADEIANLGGTLTVVAHSAKGGQASISVTIEGSNPTVGDVQTYLATRSDSDGFFAIVNHETQCRHFKNGVPIKSFDNGYGMCQLTSPAPTYAQVWNWKKNIDAGLALFGAKRLAAKNYLSSGGRSYTADQLRYETVSRWNGGSYHSWDAKTSAWVRKPSILCDSRTGNIGWDMTDAQNAGKTEAQLHKRDADSYRDPPNDKSHWGYYGVCYADAVLN